MGEFPGGNLLNMLKVKEGVAIAVPVTMAVFLINVRLVSFFSIDY